MRCARGGGAVGEGGAGAGQQTAGEWGPWQHGNLLRRAQRNHFAFLLAVQQVVVILHTHKPRPALEVGGAERAGELPGPAGARTDVAHLSRLDEVVECAERFLNRGVRVKAVDLVQIDGLDPQAFETRFARLHNVLAREAAPVGARCHGPVHFAGQHDFLHAAIVAEGAPGDLLAHAERIHVGGIEEVDARLDGAAEERAGVLLTQHPGAPVRGAVAHAAEAEAGYRNAGRTECGIAHEGGSRGGEERLHPTGRNSWEPNDTISDRM